jgi:hypothetical protein
MNSTDCVTAWHGLAVFSEKMKMDTTFTPFAHRLLDHFADYITDTAKCIRSAVRSLLSTNQQIANLSEAMLVILFPVDRPQSSDSITDTGSAFGAPSALFSVPQ